MDYLACRLLRGLCRYGKCGRIVGEYVCGFRVAVSRVGASGSRMSEVVLQIDAEESGDAARLTNALDAFAKWSSETGLSTDSGDAPDIMMMTEYSGGAMRRKLVFQDREHAARFLVFWRTEKHRGRMPEQFAAAGG